MNLLCLDTSTDYAVCAVGDELGNLLGGAAEPHERDLSVRLYPIIESVIAEASLSFDQVDILAVGIGPGSFTGVRIAVTTMRTLAQATGKKLVAVGTLEVLAHDAKVIERGQDRNVCVLLPSRRNEVYAAIYRNSKEIKSPFTASYQETHQLAEVYDDRLIYSGQDTVLNLIFPGRGGDVSLLKEIIVLASPTPIALLQLACEQANHGQFRDPLSLDPMYIAPPAISQHKNNRIAGP